jgi:alkanesulfonate monooxygenase SsuD/methylene tetrahydromethanopterin reductase-like flavin-dependent oxidoreductase (luciferase family)
MDIMKYAFYLPSIGLGGDARFLSDLAVEAERHGWDGFFIWDCLQWPGIEPCVDPWVALTAMAVRTERIVLGPMVTPLARRDIVKLARETISLDRLSGGRLVLGVGLGVQDIPEWSGFGHETDSRRRGEMLDEGLDLLTALWSGQPVSHNGAYYQVECEPFTQPAQIPRIPIWVGGKWPNKKPFRRAAKWDGVFPVATRSSESGQLSPADMEDCLGFIRGAGAQSDDYAVAVEGTTKDASDTAAVKRYAASGVNWWLESGDDLMTSREALIDRIRKGPPRN